MSILCHIADCHLGYRRFSRLTKHGQNQREADVNAAFNEAVTKIVSIKPNITLIAGDLFHSPRPSNSIITFAFRELSRLARGTAAPIVIIAGNHDSPKRKDTGSILRLFSEIEGVYIADVEVERFKFNHLSLSVTAVPYHAVHNLDESPVRPEEDSMYNVLVLHGQVKAATLSAPVETHFSLNSLNPHQWNYVALGHFHEHKEVALNTFYSGATEKTTSNIWAEEKIDCGFVEYDLKQQTKKYHKLTGTREIKNLSSIDATNLNSDQIFAEIKERINEASGKIARLQIENISRELLQQLPYKEIRALKAPTLGFIIDYVLTRPRALMEGKNDSQSSTLEVELANFVAAWEGEDKKPLSELLSKYLRRVVELDEARAS